MGELIVGALERTALFLAEQGLPPGLVLLDPVDGARRRPPDPALRPDMAINRVNQALPGHETVVALTSVYHNLLRGWADA